MPQIMLAGAGEKFQYLMHDYNDNTIRFVLRYPGIIDPDALCAAMKELSEQSNMQFVCWPSKLLIPKAHIHAIVIHPIFFRHDVPQTAKSVRFVPFFLPL